MDANRVGLVDHFCVAWCAAVRGSDGDVISADAEVFETFLHGDADGTAAAPQADQEIRAKLGPNSTIMM